MEQTDLIIVGAGPAGLCAALVAADCGLEVVVLDRQDQAGGQLVKQTHKFFGSERHKAGTRGIVIAEELSDRVMQHPRIQLLLESEVLGYYPDNVVTYEASDGSYNWIKGRRLLLATGASESNLLFPNNDLPGIYGAGAVQTLMNVQGLRPGERVLMVGAGNIGLIVTYQLLQAGVEVVAVVEAAERIGGYSVHASKIRRMGVPILTRHTVRKAIGDEVLQQVVTCKLDADWNVIPGTDEIVDVDVLCLAVGLSPLTELLWQAGCKMELVRELGGYVARIDANLQTSVAGIYVAGDAAGIEEASSAMSNGRLAGYAIANSLGLCPDFEARSADVRRDLEQLRSGPAGAKIRAGLDLLRREVTCH